VPGMNSGVNPSNSVLVSAFRSALFHQWAIVAIIFLLLLLAWGASRGWVTDGTQGRAGLATWHEPKARRLLRIGFGVLWLFDGVLQAQPQMAGGLPSQVMAPAATGSPLWVQHLVNWAGTIWSYHPVQAGAASVWIQVGIGLWMIFGVHGWSSRLAGLASVAWGLIVWVFAEAFGGILAPGLTVLFGAPGAVIIYVVAGALIALPERVWETQRTGRLILAGIGVFFAGMALLQAWPGRGFWQGTIHGQQGTLSGMVQSMVVTPQPHVLKTIVSSFGGFTAAHGFGVNLFAVLALAGLGAVFCVSALRGDARLARVGVIAGAVLCLADWVLIEDFGFLGGTGTDPNSMIPLILLFTAGWLALTPAPQPQAVPQPELAAPPEAPAAADPAGGQPQPVPVPAPAGGPVMTDSAVPPDGPVSADGPVPADGAVPAPRPGTGTLAPVPARLAAARDWVAAQSARSVAAFGAVAVILVGAAPMAFASANPNADPIVAEALNGTSAPLDLPAPGFTLTSQTGHQVSLASLHGKVVLMTFLDPVCTTDCPVIAQEFKAADTMLGAKASKTELVAVVANPTYLSTAFTVAFTRQEGFAQVPNWLYLTGSVGQLEKVWENYGITVENLPAGAMTAHNDIAFVIDPTGAIRQELDMDPGPATETTQSSFASQLSDAALQSMGANQ
jgi:cytochrome oxidase Cu insertion factor (SCO1/SenC/PrrC family)